MTSDYFTPRASMDTLYVVPPIFRKFLVILVLAFLSAHSAIMHPPPPAPVSFAPSAPAFLAPSTSLSSLGVETPICWSNSWFRFIKDPRSSSFSLFSDLITEFEIALSSSRWLRKLAVCSRDRLTTEPTNFLVDLWTPESHTR